MTDRDPSIPGPDPLPGYGLGNAQQNPYIGGEYYLPAAYAPPPSYGYGPAYGYLGQPPRPTEGMAIASLVLSCFAMLGLCFWGIGGLPFGILGGVFGHVARSRIRKSGAGGEGMALAGVIVGWIATGLSILAFGALLTFIILDDSGSNY